MNGWQMDKMEELTEKAFTNYTRPSSEWTFKELYESGYKAAVKEAEPLVKSLEYYFDVLKEVRGYDWDKNPDHVLQKMIDALAKFKGEK